MSLITTLRGQRPSARNVLAALMLVWLNVVLQPCLMAMPASSVPAVQATQQYEAEPMNPQGQHSVFHGEDDEHEDCSHCAAFGRGDCGEGGGCSELDVVQSNGTVKLKDGASKVLAVLPTAGLTWQTPALALAANIIRRAETQPPGASLTIRYCVYLI